MEITLEKIDIVRERTGATYKEAKEVLEASGGNVVDAIITLEEKSNTKWTESFNVKGSEAVEKLKDIIKAGNVNRIRVKKDNTTILDIPITAGAIGAVIIPQITAIGAVVALLTKCTIEVERPDKSIVDVGEVINDTVDNMAEKVKKATNDLKEKGEQTVDNIEEKIDNFRNKDNEN